MPKYDPRYKPPKSYLQLNGDGTVTPVGKARKDNYPRHPRKMFERLNQAKVHVRTRLEILAVLGFGLLLVLVFWATFLYDILFGD